MHGISKIVSHEMLINKLKLLLPNGMSSVFGVSVAGFVRTTSSRIISLVHVTHMCIYFTDDFTVSRKCFMHQLIGSKNGLWKYVLFIDATTCARLVLFAFFAEHKHW